MKVKMSFVGDIFSGNLPYTIGFGVGSHFERFKGKDWHSQLKHTFAEKHIVFGNFESPIIKNPSIRNTESFASNPKFAEFIAEIGFNIVSIANNHILEYGTEAFEDTIDIIRKNNIKVVGLNIQEQSNIEIFNVGDTTIAFAAFNDIHDHHNQKQYAELKFENIVGTLQRMKADIKIISLHWGSEYVPFPSPDQMKFARVLIDSGANIIIGHHPHVMQPVETYNNGIICYSLGNYIFDMHWSRSLREGMLIDIEINSSGKMSYCVKFIRINKDYLPQLISTPKRQIKQLSKSKSKMHIYESKGREGNLKYLRLAKKNRILQRIKSKWYWITNSYRQPHSIRRKIALNFLNKIAGIVLLILLVLRNL